MDSAPNAGKVSHKWVTSTMSVKSNLTREELFEYESRINPQCFKCRHAIALMGGPICQAFPDGIPAKIWTGKFDHTLPFPGDHGIQFDLREPFLSDPNAGKRTKEEVEADSVADDESDYSQAEQEQIDQILENLTHCPTDPASLIAGCKRAIVEIESIHFQAATQKIEAEGIIDSLHEVIGNQGRKLTVELFTD